MHPMRALGGLGLLLLLSAGTAFARGYEGLGVLEKQALDDALEARGLTLDPAPDGKTIGQIHVVNHPVFSKRDSYFQLLNIFHRTTREHLIAREALFRPGQPYRQEIIDETIRHLQDPDLSSTVVIVPVVSVVPGTVDVLIVTRDVWSLRLNTNFEIQQGHVLGLQASLSENNLFGLRKQVALVFDMDQGRMAVGPLYIDRNVAGTRLTFSTSARALFRREDGKAEGSSSSTTLSYPLFSLASRWGASVGLSHANAVSRAFLDNDLRRVDLPSTTQPAPRGTPVTSEPGAGIMAGGPAVVPKDMESVPESYRYRQFSTSAGVTRQFGKTVIQQVSGGHRYRVFRPSFTSDFPEDPAVRREFARLIFPRSERVSELYLAWNLFTPRYYVYRNLETFDLREDRRLGPSASAGVSRAARALGSERNFSGVSAAIGWAFGYGGGLQGASAGWSSRIEGGQIIDQTYSAGLYAVSPVLWRALRVIGTAGASVIVDNTHNSRYFLGGDNGLRGYVVGDFVGRARGVGHLEVRSMPLSVASFRLGGVAFYDVGDADFTERGTGIGLVRAVRAVLRLRPRSDVGLGLRLLIPQLNAYVLRLDCAFPLQSTTRTVAGRPRFSLGFQQAF